MLVGRFQIVVDVLEIQVDVAAPFGHRFGFKNIKCFQAKLPHPIGFVFDVGNLIHYIFIEALLSLEDAGGFRTEVVFVDFADFGGF